MSPKSCNIMAKSLLSFYTHNPDGEILIYGDQRIRWKDLVPRVLKIAQGLVELGVQKDDKVIFMFHNTPEFFEINFGIQVAGAIPCPMNYRFVSKEIEFQGNHSDAVVFFFDDIWKDAVLPAMKNLPKVKQFICKGDHKAEGILNYEAFINAQVASDPKIENDWEDVAVMIYTGGTTGFPKGVMLTYKAHLDMFSTLAGYAVSRMFSLDIPKERKEKLLEEFPLPLKPVFGRFYYSETFKNIMKKPKTREFIMDKARKDMMNPKKKRKKAYENVRKAMFPSMPFFHDASYAQIINAGFTGATTFVLPQGIKFEPKRILELIEKESVTTVSNVPTGWKKLLDYPDFNRYDVSSVRTATTGGGLCPKDLKQKILRAFPDAMVFDGFGQTEMTPLTSFRIDTDPESIEDRSVGNSIVDVKIVDENNTELPQGQPGEILYRSSTVMKGYYKDEGKTREVIEDGWFRSGDLGYIDEFGEIRLIDRKKECINTGGEKVFPLEVEEVVSQHPKVDVVCIIGVPDEDWGNQVRGIVQLRTGETAEPEEIIEFCKGKLAGYKIPKTIVFVEEIPFSPAGKMLRQKVREAYGEGYGKAVGASA